MHNYMPPNCRLCGSAYQNMDYPKKWRENEIITCITDIRMAIVLCSDAFRPFSQFDGY